jgi:hypothetical protein
MESAPELPTSSPSATPQRRRLHHRQRIASLIYVTLDHDNGGVLRDLSGRGVGLQAVSPLHVGQPVRVRFDLAHPKVRVETAGRVAWADAHGQAGVTFQNLEERSPGAIKQWIFTQLLSRAHQVSETETEFALSAQQESVAELHFSASSRPAIRLEKPASPAIMEDGERSPITLILPWLPFPVSPHVLSQCVDGAILLAAVTLFSVIAILMIETVPAWPGAVFLLLAAGSLFALTYWGLFTVWVGETPGAHLARIAGKLGGEEKEDRPRFR